MPPFVASFLKYMIIMLLMGELVRPTSPPPPWPYKEERRGRDSQNFLSLSLSMFPKCSSKFPINFPFLVLHMIEFLTLFPLAQ